MPPAGRGGRGWWQAAGAVLQLEWLLLRQHPRLTAAAVGLLFVQALYALIYLYAVWDPAAHTRALPAGLVKADTGARYRERELAASLAPVVQVIAPVPDNGTALTPNFVPLAVSSVTFLLLVRRWCAVPLAQWRPPLDIR